MPYHPPLKMLAPGGPPGDPGGPKWAPNGLRAPVPLCYAATFLAMANGYASKIGSA